MHIAGWRLYVHMRRTRARARTREYVLSPIVIDLVACMRAGTPPRPGSDQGTTPSHARAIGQRVDSNG
jgi:hypothetical protein